MKVYFLAVILVSLSTFGLNDSQEYSTDTEDNWNIEREPLDQYSGQEGDKGVDYEDDQKGNKEGNQENDYNFKSGVTPEKIGELQFEVEVAEQTPQSGEIPPEMLVYDKSGKNEIGNDFEIITEIPVDVMGSSQIGGIQFDIEVEESKTKSPEGQEEPNDVVNFQHAPPNPFVPNVRANGSSSSSTIAAGSPPQNPSNSSNAPPVNPSVSPIVNSSDTTTVDPNATTTVNSNDTTKIDSSAIIIDDTKTTPSFVDTTTPSKTEESTTEPIVDIPPDNPNIENPEGEEAPIGPFETEPAPVPHSTAAANPPPIWPIILVSVVFIILVVVGVCWAIYRLCAVKQSEQMEEKKIERAKSKGPDDEGPPGGAPVAAGQPGPVPSDEQPKESGEEPDSSTKKATRKTSSDELIPKKREVKPFKSTEDANSQKSEELKTPRSAEDLKPQKSSEEMKTPRSADDLKPQKSSEALKSPKSAEELKPQKSSEGVKSPKSSETPKSSEEAPKPTEEPKTGDESETGKESEEAKPQKSTEEDSSKEVQGSEEGQKPPEEPEKKSSEE